MSQKDVFFASVGCQKTNLDGLHARRYFESNGWRAVSDPQEASLICVGTCAFMASMEERSIALVEKMLQENPHARVVVSGCIPAIKARQQIFSRPVEMVPADAPQEWEKVIAPEKKSYEENTGFDPSFIARDGFSETFLSRVRRYLFDFGLSNSFLNASQRIVTGWRQLWASQRPPYLLEISRGCLEQCSYCVVRFARGRLRSRPLNEIVEEFSKASQQGFKRFVLIASDTGCYGLDRGSSFSALLSALFATSCDLQELVILDFNVKWLIQDHAALVPLFVKHQDKIILNAMTQHVSDRLLALMKRGYRSQDMVRHLRELRQKAPRLVIGTNLIVGFPSESHEEFRSLINFLKQIRFNKLLVYQYSPRPGTAAAELPDPVPAWVKLCRMLRLEAVQLMMNFRRGSESFVARISKKSVLKKILREVGMEGKKRGFRVFAWILGNMLLGMVPCTGSFASDPVVDKLDQITAACAKAYPREYAQQFIQLGGKITNPKGGFGITTRLDALTVYLEKYLKPGQKFIDLGSGDGRVVFVASLFGAQAYGIEYDKTLVDISMKARKTLSKKVIDPEKVHFIQGDFFDHDFSAYDVLYLNIGCAESLRLIDKIDREAAPGSILIMYWMPDEVKFKNFRFLEGSVPAQSIRPHFKVFQKNGPSEAKK